MAERLATLVLVALAEVVAVLWDPCDVVCLTQFGKLVEQ
jgi:hypothetical protein